MKLPSKGLYAITDTSHIDYATMLEKTHAILQAGAHILQYRFTETEHKDRIIQATQLNQLCHLFKVPLIINNDIDLAMQINAAGVHLGKDDPPIDEARATLGKHAIIGCSCYNDLSRASDAIGAGADYLAFGAFFPSPSKPEATYATPAIITQAKLAFVDTCVVAIGGITPENGRSLITAGADILAVISGLYRSAHPFNATTKYINLFT